jgi:ABC-2 type transport system permease protein
MTGALRAEWTKLRTDNGTAWILAAICVLTVAVGAATAAVTRCGGGGCAVDPTKVSLTGIEVGQAVVAVVGSLAAGRLLLAGNGVTVAHAITGPVIRAAAGSVLYLALIGLLALGVATIVRDSAAATGAVLGILYVPPAIALFLGSDPAWQRWVERYTPVNAGLAILNTTGLRDLVISPWAGLGVLAAWAAVALLAAGVLLRLRDA